MDKIKNVSSMNELRKAFFNVVSKNEYSKHYQGLLRMRFNSLEKYMKTENISQYTPEIGNAFVTDFMMNRKKGGSVETGINVFVLKLNDIYYGNEFCARHNKSPRPKPIGFQAELQEYVSFCLDKGNRATTISQKVSACSAFCLALNNMGCFSPDKFSETFIIRSCLTINNKDSWRFIREFLEYLYATQKCRIDYSYLVPKAPRKEPLPSVYSNEEIERINATINTSTKSGKRDICLMLLESLTMRSGDIVKLTFNELDFANDRISYIQEKTEKPISLLMPPEVKRRLLDYIDNARPKSNDAHVFLRINAPFVPITTSALRQVSKKYILKSGIDPDGRHFGPHSRRASSATWMINDGVSYDSVKKVLGHSDPNAVKHYAALDKNHLRNCALPAPPPTGMLKELFNGRCTL